MNDEQRPLRQLSRIGRLLVRRRRCPTCLKKLASVPHDQIASWSNTPRGMGTFGNSFTASSFGRSRVGHVTQVRHGKIPHCPRCQHTFVHGWIFPANAQIDNHNAQRD